MAGECGLVGRLGNALEKTKNSGIEGLIQICHVFVRPVDRKGVLDQVVRTHAEKIRFFREEVGDHGRRRYFDHDPDLYVFIEGNIFGPQVVFTSSRTIFASRSSARPEIMGKRIFTLPWTLALRMPRSWALKTSFL